MKKWWLVTITGVACAIAMIWRAVTYGMPALILLAMMYISIALVSTGILKIHNLHESKRFNQRIREAQANDFFLETWDGRKNQFLATVFLRSLGAKSIYYSDTSREDNQYRHELTCLIGGVQLALISIIHESGEGHLTGSALCNAYSANDTECASPIFGIGGSTDDSELIWCICGESMSLVVPRKIYEIWRKKAEEYSSALITSSDKDTSTSKTSP